MKRYVGQVFVWMGTLWLLADVVLPLPPFNALLVVPLLFVIFGLVLHVWQQKSSSRY